MKKLLLFSLALGLLIGSCAKDPESIPPITPQPQPQPSNTIEAANATASDYVSGKKATVHGNISVDGTKSYFVFKDGTKILLYSPKSVFDALSADTKTKLKTNGHELTATGTFKDFTPKNSTTVVKQLVYESENDLKFGQGTTPQPQPSDTIEAANATASDYVVGKKATVHGNISVDGTKSYFVFKDGTKILLYSPKSVFDALSADTKTKLKTNGQELTATGTFKDFTPKNSTTVVKQLVYESENDLKFGQGTTPQPQPSDTIEAANATASDYVVGKKATVHGNISVDGTKSYFVFKDGTKILLYSPKSVFDALSADTKTKLKTNGQELTATGTFKDFTPKNSTTVIKQLVYESEDALKFGQGTTPQPNPNPSPSGIFDFEWITNISKSYGNAVEKESSDGVKLEAQGRTETKEDIDYAIDGKGLVLNGYKKGYIKITFPNGVKNFSFDYKPFYTNTKSREFIIYEGDENSTTELDKKKFAYDTPKATYSKEFNKTGSYTITIKLSNPSKQVIFDNIKWTN
ncbi:DNA-binding protein [Capnocytophaga sp. G2]|uniref:DNA-binding protein n=1 Tax=Capnocytophaga sp. G2 TaxID=3110695 RepID=UPI002B483318|nr:DNA-binding protein [Capnocytophaga sp. G2]MEB3005865.1 DNA-binding protein [Capnocytophaga sp. G2]